MTRINSNYQPGRQVGDAPLGSRPARPPNVNALRQDAAAAVQRTTWEKLPPPVNGEISWMRTITGPGSDKAIEGWPSRALNKTSPISAGDLVQVSFMELVAQKRSVRHQLMLYLGENLWHEATVSSPPDSNIPQVGALGWLQLEKNDRITRACIQALQQLYRALWTTRPEDPEYAELQSAIQHYQRAWAHTPAGTNPQMANLVTLLAQTDPEMLRIATNWIVGVNMVQRLLQFLVAKPQNVRHNWAQALSDISGSGIELGAITLTADPTPDPKYHRPASARRALRIGANNNGQDQ